MFGMEWREFIALLGEPAAAWLLSTSAQHAMPGDWVKAVKEIDSTGPACLSPTR